MEEPVSRWRCSRIAAFQRRRGSWLAGHCRTGSETAGLHPVRQLPRGAVRSGVGGVVVRLSPQLCVSPLDLYRGVAGGGVDLRGPQADRKCSATREGWSKGIGGGDAFMKLCVSSSGCKARPARGEPAQAGSEPGDGLRNGTGEAEVRERVGHGTCGPDTYTLPGCPGC